MTTTQTLPDKTQNNPYQQSGKFYFGATLGVFMVGAGLAIWQFIFNRDLWYDEALLANNFVNRTFWAMFLPLDEKQAAPILFLLIEKGLFDLLPHKEYALRIMPLTLYMCSAVLFYKMLHLIFKDPKIILFGALLFSINYFLIYYSSEVKQYMGDVFSILLMYYLVLKGEVKENQNVWVLGIIGSVMIFFSNVAPIILASTGLYLMLKAKKLEDLKPYLPMFLIWALVFVVYYLLFIKDHPLKAYMQDFWKVKYGFLPDFDNPQRLLMYFKLKFVMMFRLMLSMWTVEKYLMFFLFACGMGSLLYFKRYGWTILLLFPLVSHFFLSVFEVYPLELRLFLYYTPLLILVICFGLDEIIKLLRGKPAKFAYAFIGLVFLVSLSGIIRSFAGNFPVQSVNVRGLMTFVAEELKEGQVIFSYDKEAPSMRYYSSMGYWEDLPLVFTDYEIMEGNKGLELIREVPGSLWLVFEHHTPELHYDWERTMNSNGITILRKQCFSDSCGYEVEI
ncbi:glycosyltransferase family 39 protein [Pleomorphovibrio marinus]|uniref:glycosyltransferase family 39 protein n=1 Tax=Pleomorphovibrio marinus TaxID=2164132 RepID=UPI0013003909|nr:glycosyltransferase family 39 protein [Pleomorphovibrio marinus]